MNSQTMTNNSSFVLFCIIRRKRQNSSETEYLMMPKIGYQPSFPATKYHKNEDLYTALERIITGDLSLGQDSFFPETELPMLKNRKISKQYPGLEKDYYLYPVEVSFTEKGWEQLTKNNSVFWYTLDEIQNKTNEPNILAIAKQLNDIIISEKKPDSPVILGPVKSKPTMDALANMWAKQNNEGVRKLGKNTISEVLNAGNRAFNLRVADPYLAYQRQGLGFTWSFFTPKDKQDIHLHGEPAVEIYGVMEGQFILWHKPMYERGALVWKKEILNAGDWIEVEALHCHFGYWTTNEGYGTVLKAAGTGELAGVGRIGVSGKTICKECPVEKQCQKHPEMLPILQEYQKIFEERDWDLIGQSGKK
jgi:hypothetical protein